MDMMQVHATALQTTSTAYHEFLLKYKPNKSIVYGFVEGKDDPMFYHGLIEQALPSDWDIELIPAGNRDKVINSYKKFDWNRHSKKQICFFIDRDLTDFVEKETMSAENIYTTDGYSIENEVLNFGTYIRIIREIFNITGIDEQSRQKICTAFNDNLQIFTEALYPIMAQIILWQKEGLNPILSNIDTSTLFNFINGNAKIKDCYATTDQRVAYASKCTKLPMSPTLARNQVEIEFLKMKPTERFIRGKYALSFLLESAISTHQSIHILIPLLSKPPSPKITIGEKNAMIFIAPRMRCPETLRNFFNRTFLTHISTTNSQAR